MPMSDCCDLGAAVDGSCLYSPAPGRARTPVRNLRNHRDRSRSIREVFRQNEVAFPDCARSSLSSWAMRSMVRSIKKAPWTSCTAIGAGGWLVRQHAQAVDRQSEWHSPATRCAALIGGPRSRSGSRLPHRRPCGNAYPVWTIVYTAASTSAIAAAVVGASRFSQRSSTHLMGRPRAMAR